jgi:hypothetical protein
MLVCLSVYESLCYLSEFGVVFGAEESEEEWEGRDCLR